MKRLFTIIGLILMSLGVLGACSSSTENDKLETPSKSNDEKDNGEVSEKEDPHQKRRIVIKSQGEKRIKKQRKLVRKMLEPLKIKKILKLVILQLFKIRWVNLKLLSIQ